MKAAGFLAALWVLGMLANAAGGAENSANAREYAFDLQTLNLGEIVRRGQRSDTPLKFNVDDAMTEDELESVKSILDELGASQPDDDGTRHFSLPNGTRVSVGGFLEEASGGMRTLPVGFSVENQFSTTEASLVLRLATAGNLFIFVDEDRVATVVQSTDRRFLRRYKHAAVTADENSLAEWVRQNTAR